MTNSSFEIDTPTSSIPDSENLFLISSKEVDKWFLMRSPLPVISIVAAYLLFVLKIGPKFMRDRKPLEIKSLIVLYNLFQIIYNVMMVSKMFTTPGAIQYFWKHSCYPLDPAINPLYQHFNEAAWYFLLSKTIELLDTVFLVLRKKQSHITFIHVYHHSSLAILSWVYLKYIKGEQGVVFGFNNALIRIIIYAYYFLSTLGPQVRKYLWWKRYVTQLLILQLINMVIYMTSLILMNCRLPKFLSILMVFHGVLYLIFTTKLKKNMQDKANGTMPSVVKKAEKVQ